MTGFARHRDYLFSYEKLASNFTSSLQDTELIDKIKASLIPVMNSAKELDQFIMEHHDYVIVPYLLYKDDPLDALLSTSSMHMNWLWPDLLYVPANIKKEDHAALRHIYQTAYAYENIIFFNHTIPHKSNPVMLDMFSKNKSERGDYLSRSGNSFVIADGNGQAFAQMTKELANDEIDLTKVTVVIVGVGGAGELAARAIRKESPQKLLLVDITDKSALAKELGASFYQVEKEETVKKAAQKIVAILPDLSNERLVIIDATAHFEDNIQRCVALDLVEKYNATGNIFIDYNMNTEIGAYNYLKSATGLGVCAGVGKEYVAVTNYIMVLDIIKAAKLKGIDLPFVSREFFDQKVAQSVMIRDKIKHVLKK